MKKVMSLVLALVMALCLCSVSWATSEAGNEGGDGGTAANVAEVTVGETTTQYTNIDEALAAWAANGGTLKLLADCTASETVSMQRGNSATLDLNGHTLDMGAKYISAGDDLTVKDSGSIGKLIGTSYYVIQGGWYSRITINGGEISNTVKSAISNGAIIMNGGKLIGAADSYGVSTYKNVTVNKGEISALVLNYGVESATLGETDGDYADVRIGKLQVYNSNIVVNFNSGIVGTFDTYYTPTLNTTDNAYFENTFTKGLPGGTYLASVGKDGKTYYQVKELNAESAAAKITAAGGAETLYADASVAAANLKAGGTLTLLKDHQGGTMRIDPGAGSVTVDLNGKTVTNTSGPALYVNINGAVDATEPYTVTVKNGTLVSTTQVALRVDSVNNAADVVTENVAMTAGAGSALVDLQDEARLKVTDEAAARKLLGTGFLVTVNGTNYAYGIVGGLGYAVKALPAAGGTVKLLGDYTGAQKLSYTDTTNKPVVLDLNNKTYNYTYKDGIAALELARPNSNLTVTNGTIISAGLYGVYGVASDYAASSANNLTLTLDGVTIQATSGNGVGINGTLTGNVTTIKNSTIIAADTGVYYPAVGTLTIENSVITGGKLGVALKGGTTTISGDKTKISASAAEKQPTEYYGGSGGGITAEGYALYVEGGYTDRDVILNVNGGHFDSKGDAVKKFVKDGETTQVKREITVTSGGFSSNVEAFVKDSTLAVAEIASGGSTTYYVGQAAASAANDMKSGDTLTVKQGKVTVGSKTVSAGQSYTKTASYYYRPAGKTEGGKTTSPKTFDAGIGVYAVTAALSVTGMAWTAKKRH